MDGFYIISWNIDEVLSINPSANVFVFGDFKVHHQDCLTCCGGTGRLCELVIIFLSQMASLILLTLLLRSRTMTLIVLLFRIYLFLLTLVFVLQWLYLHWETDHVVISVSIDFLSDSKGYVPFHHIAYDYSRADWNGLRDHWEMFHGRISSNSVFLLLLVSFVMEFRLELMCYIPHRFYQVKLHSSAWFSAAWAAPIIYRKQFFRLYQQNKSESKVKFRQASNYCKSVLEGA